MAAELVQSTPSKTSAQLQRSAIKAWGMAGVLSAEDKQVLNSPAVVELGIRLEGEKGLLGISPARLLKTLWASVYWLQLPRWEKKMTQVVLGRWIFALQFRRAAMGVLSRVWEVVEAPWPRPAQVSLARNEVLALMCLAPLIQTDMRVEYHPTVTVSDASETGGAAACSNGLTWSGKSLATFWNDARLRPIELPILLVSIFNGMGGAFRIYDVLGIQVAGRISVDSNKHANRVTRSTWPGLIELHNILDITRSDVAEWANQFPRVSEVHVMAGFPCVHLSSVRAGRQNLSGEGSNLFWTLLEVLGWIHEIFGTFCKVKHTIENVASMDEAARREISRHLDITPIKLDPADVMPFSRPRLAWCSVELYAMEGLELWSEKEYFRATVSAPEISSSSWIRPGWTWPSEEMGTKFPTFMKSIRRSRPPPVPAGLNRASQETINRWTEDSFRFPPYQYSPQFLLHHPQLGQRILDASERELLLGFGPHHTSTCMSASEVKKSKVEFEDVRKTLCGDSFAVLSFAIMASQMCAELVPRMPPAKILDRLGLAPGASAHPSVSAPISRWLNYGGCPSLSDVSEKDLVESLGLMVNHTGADVCIQTGQVLGGKIPAHGSVRAWWWQWKNLFKIRWVSPSHINSLEMKMILNTLLWKARNPSAVNSRWLHLEDSVVCLYILCKGRTSSKLLQPICNKIGALQLGLGVTVLHGHVSSSENPTDAASRA
jgi:hypothetical protein